MKKICNNSHYIILGHIFVFLYCLPYLILGSNSYINPHDYLDSTIAHFKSIINNNLFFSFGGELPLMNGVDRMIIPYVSPFEFKGLLFYLFPGYWGVFFNIVIVKLCAFIGMYLLLEKYITERNKILAFVVAILFTLVPFYVDYSFSSAGIPLLLYALINIHQKEYSVLSYVLVLLYALNSSLSLSGLFICIVLFGAIIWWYIKEKKIKWRLMTALCLLAVTYIVINLPLITSFFVPTENVSHRVEMVKDYSFMELAEKYVSCLIACQYHAGSFMASSIILVFLLTTIMTLRKDKSLFQYAIYFVILAILIFCGLMAKMIPLQIFSSFQFDRFYFLYPTLCFIMLAKSCEVLLKHTHNIWVIGILIFSFVCVLRTNSDYKVNLLKIAGREAPQMVSFEAFYDEPLFKEMSKKLNIPLDYSVKVVSVGIYPSIAEYNGFYCLDSYVSSYSLSYKHKFREIIAGELDKDEVIRKYYDNWGSRCYLFSAELDEKGNRYMCGKLQSIIIEHLDIDSKVLKEIGCQYILSAVDIRNYRDLNLEYLDSFSTDHSFWNLRVYKIL